MQVVFSLRCRRSNPPINIMNGRFSVNKDLNKYISVAEPQEQANLWSKLDSGHKILLLINPWPHNDGRSTLFPSLLQSLE